MGMSARRTRSAAAAVTGACLVVANLTGLLAQFSDTATTGTNDVSTPVAGRAADLKLAAYTGNPENPCGTFTDDLETGLLEAAEIAYYDDGEGGFGSVAARSVVCLRNDGMAALEVSIAATDVAFTEIGCDGDEAAVDPTCAPGAAGEFQPSLQLSSASHDPDSGQALEGECHYENPDKVRLGASGNHAIATMSDAPIALGTLPAGGVACLYIPVFDPAPVSTADLQARQSDRASWRFLFAGASA
jgi:hypothetical protein